MYKFALFFLLILGIFQEWHLTARVYTWLASDRSSTIAVLQIAVSFFLAAVLGIKLFSRVGLQLLRKAQQQVASGRVPDRTLAEGFFLIAAAILLIIPGYLSDLLGLLSLFLRKPLASLALRNIKKNLANGRIRVQHFGEMRSAPFTQKGIDDSTVVIDVQPLDEKK